MIRESLEPDAAAGVKAVPRLQQAPEAEGDQIVEIAPKRELSAKSVRQTVDHSLVLRDELGSLHADS
jgi:hypothetical protein